MTARNSNKKDGTICKMLLTRAIYGDDAIVATNDDDMYADFLAEQSTAHYQWQI